jgi:hypothetical protein
VWDALGGQSRVQVEHLRDEPDHAVVPRDVRGVGEVDSAEINGGRTAASVNAELRYWSLLRSKSSRIWMISAGAGIGASQCDDKWVLAGYNFMLAGDCNTEGHKGQSLQKAAKRNPKPGVFWAPKPSKTPIFRYRRS